jgi:hypothetical protein
MTAITETDAEVDVVSALTRVVDVLGDDLPALMDACTDPQGTDLAELLAALQDARKTLQGLERDAELATAKAMLDDYAETPTLRVERHRATDRKAWDHDAWKRDVRAKAVQAAGLKGCHIVLPTGELLDGTAANEVLYGLLDTLQAAHGAAAPKTTALRGLGLDARDYCESSPGAWHVRVTRMADETEGGGNA